MKSENQFLDCSVVEEKLSEMIFDDFEDSKETFQLHQHTKNCKNCSKLLNQMKVGFGLISDKFKRENTLTLSDKNKHILEQLDAGEQISRPSRRIKLHNIPKKQYTYPSTGRIAAAIAIIVISIQVIMLMEPKDEIRITKHENETAIPKGFVTMQIDTENVDENGYRIDPSKNFPEFSVTLDENDKNKLFEVQLTESKNDDTHANFLEINDNDTSSTTQIVNNDKEIIDNHNLAHLDLNSDIPAIKQDVHSKENSNLNHEFNKGTDYPIANNTNKQPPKKDITTLATPSYELEEEYTKPKTYVPHFYNPHSNPISSFPVYANGKSYHDFKQALSLGNLPAVTSIKPEEFINAFDYRTKEPINKRYTLQTNFLKSPYTDSHVVLRIALKSNSKMAPITDFAIQLEFNPKTVLKYRKIGYDTEITSDSSQNKLSPKRLNTVALYELEMTTKPSSKEKFLTIRTRYRDTLTNKILHDNVSVSKNPNLSSKTIHSHPRLYQPLFLAEYSNYLRNKAHSKTNYAQLIKHAHIFLKAYPEDPAIRSLCKGIQQYRKIKSNSLQK